MTQLVRYCKAFPAARFESFAAWVAPRNSGTASPDNADGVPADDYWFLQDSYVVTRGITPDEDIVFDQISPEWIEFCRTELGFAIPDDLIEESPEEESQAPADLSATQVGG